MLGLFASIPLLTQYYRIATRAEDTIRRTHPTERGECFLRGTAKVCASATLLILFYSTPFKDIWYVSRLHGKPRILTFDPGCSEGIEHVSELTT